MVRSKCILDYPVIRLTQYLIVAFAPWRKESGANNAGLLVPKEMYRWREIVIVLVIAAVIAGLSALYPLLLQLEGVFFRIGVPWSSATDSP